MNQDFGHIIKALRLNLNLTQENLANKIGYSRDTIRNLENGKSVPSLNLLNKLSYLFQIDLNRYFYNWINELFSPVQENYYNFKYCIKAEEILIQNNLVIECKSNEYNPYTKNLKLCYYISTLCAFENGEITLIYNYIKKIFEIDNLDINNLSIKNQIFDTITYDAIALLGTYYYLSKNYNSCEKIINSLYSNLKNNFFKLKKLTPFSTQYIIKIYSYTMNNFATIMIHNNEYAKANELLNNAIEFCTNHYRLAFLPYIYINKFECQYHLKNYQIAKKNLEYSLLLFEISNDKNIIALIKSIEDNFKNILPYIDLKAIRNNINK